MAPTHLLVGLAVGSVSLVVAPAHTTSAFVAGALGGLAPDLDAVVGTHRRTLHFPVYGWVVALPAVVLAVLVTASWSVALATFCVAAALHPLLDWAEGDAGWRGWERTSDRAVYCHATSEWLVARRWVRYDGAPEDLLVAALLAGGLWTVTTGTVRWVVLASLVAGAGYALVRRRVPDAVERFRART
ncbi:metal-dependent hydrolase [Halomarina oriensis]|uniref:Metal-dependent hydrolase n=2 Tax=Halomarina oriensis TaxID=671145 RepID=A0A6B0GTV1_9EURY|nr:metal-dependent hydrolase [Halomarina oriensis]